MLPFLKWFLNNYYNDKILGSAFGIVNSVKMVVVLGFSSIDDCLKEEHFCFENGEDRANFFEGSKGYMLKHIIGHFSQPLSVVLDLTGLDGKPYLYIG